MTLTEQWRAALADVVIRHPNRESRVVLEIYESAEPTLRIALDRTWDSRTDEPITPFVISNVRLTYFPGLELARQWLAAAWAGYVQHEALELVTVGDRVTRPLDPHAPPFMFDKGLRHGMPVALTPETLVRTLAVVMPQDAAEELAYGH